MCSCLKNIFLYPCSQALGLAFHCLECGTGSAGKLGEGLGALPENDTFCAEKNCFHLSLEKNCQPLFLYYKQPKAVLGSGNEVASNQKLCWGLGMRLLETQSPV